jgi:hypothetical protein
MCATPIHYIYTLEESQVGGREKGEEDGGHENHTCINVSSD